MPYQEMSRTEPHLVQEIAAWLEKNASDMHASLNAGTIDAPVEWPEKLREYYRAYNGQKIGSDFLFPELGNWLSVNNAIKARTLWLDHSKDCDSDWYDEGYFPIVACLDSLESATVIDIKTGRVGNVDIELQTFEILFDNVDDLFSSLLDALEAEGYPACVDFETPTDQDIDRHEQQSALALEQENSRINENPSPEQLFDWAVTIFRNKGDPKYSAPSLHFMHLAKRYFDKIPLSNLSKKQARELAFFHQRYLQITKDTRLDSRQT